ncbi:MAG: peptidylprolyl isomerase [Acidobacteria bacterium]|nr:peptidylprolyl isomerase [Acidobacteriota bacterium]
MHTLTLALTIPTLLAAQNPASPKPELTKDTVVAVSGGKKLTAGEINGIVESLPPGMRQNYTRDPKGFLSQWFILKRLVAIAEQMKLQEQSPYKEGIEVARMQVLWQAVVEEISKTQIVTAEEQRKHYEQRKGDYLQAKVKIIYIPFVTAQTPVAQGARKPLAESEALAKSESVVAQIRNGADFIKLVKEHSEDPVSKEKDGDFGPIKRTDKLPDAIKQAVFALKPGEVSDPVRQPNGYYVLKLVALESQPFEQVKDAIFGDLKNAKMREWMDSNAKAVEVKVERPDFFESVK